MIEGAKMTKKTKMNGNEVKEVPLRHDGEVFAAMVDGLRMAVYRDGGVEFRDAQGRIHREGGPAVLWPDGSLTWCRHGLTHRVGGPAVIRPSGEMEWWENGKLLRRRRGVEGGSA